MVMAHRDRGSDTDNIPRENKGRKCFLCGLLGKIYERYQVIAASSLSNLVLTKEVEGRHTEGI